MGVLFSIIRIHCDAEKIPAHPIFIAGEETLPFIQRHIPVEDFEESLLDLFVGIWLELRHAATIFGAVSPF